MQKDNLELVQGMPCLEGRTTVLAGEAKLELGGEVLDALIIKPYAQHIPLDTPFQQLVLYMRQYAETVGLLFEEGYLHRDLTYSNLLVSADGPRICDWQSMISEEVGVTVSQLCCVVQHVF